MSREIAQGTEPGVAGCLGAAVGGIESLNERIAEYNRRIEQIAKGSVSRGCSAQTGERGGSIDCVDLRSDPGRSAPISPQPGCGMFSRVASWAQELWYERAAEHISKEGDGYLRTLIVQGAHYIFRPFGEDSDLRRWGLKLADAEERMPRNEPSLPWLGSWPCCFTNCG